MGAGPVGSRLKSRADRKTAAAIPPLLNRAFPLCYGAGIFVASVGFGSALCAMLGTEWVSFGIVAGAISGVLGIVALRRRVGAMFGPPSRGKVIALYAAVVSEMVVFGGISAFDLCNRCSEKNSWLIALAIVALHFILMGWSLGFWVIWLAAVNLGWLLIALEWGVALQTVLVVDGLIKIAFGGAAARQLWRSMLTQRGSSWPST